MLGVHPQTPEMEQWNHFRRVNMKLVCVMTRVWYAINALMLLDGYSMDQIHVFLYMSAGCVTSMVYVISLDYWTLDFFIQRIFTVSGLMFVWGLVVLSTNARGEATYRLAVSYWALNGVVAIVMYISQKE